jgi:hypothetical protein
MLALTVDSGHVSVTSRSGRFAKLRILKRIEASLSLVSTAAPEQKQAAAASRIKFLLEIMLLFLPAV